MTGVAIQKLSIDGIMQELEDHPIAGRATGVDVIQTGVNATTKGIASLATQAAALQVVADV